MKTATDVGGIFDVAGIPVQEVFRPDETQPLFDALRERNPAVAGSDGPLTLEYVQPVDYSGELTPQLTNAVSSHDELEKITIFEGGLVQRQTTKENLEELKLDWVELHLRKGAYNWHPGRYPEFFTKPASLGLEFPTENQAQEAEVFEQIFRDALGAQNFSFRNEEPVFEKKTSCSMIHARDYRVSFWFRLVDETLPLVGDQDYHLALFAQRQACDPLLDPAEPDLARLEHFVANYWQQFMPVGKAELSTLVEEVIERAKRRRLVVEMTRKISDEVVSAGRRVIVPKLHGQGFIDPTGLAISAVAFPQVNVHPTFTKDLKHVADFMKKNQPFDLKSTVKPLFSFQKPWTN